ncbi:MAG: hypothetical protein JWO43_171 [Candidatus Adlerbacteria bacterium]|nr:hypothetical protein [Candidatus Adlerbacteria bacterium]
MPNNISQLVVAVVLVAAGVIVPWWPLCILGLLLASLSGHSATSLLIGLYLDLLWGIPPGHLFVIPWHWLVLPCTLLAAVLFIARRVVVTRMMVKMPKRI